MDTANELLNLYFYGATHPQKLDLQTEGVKRGVLKLLNLRTDAQEAITYVLDQTPDALAPTLESLRSMALYASEHDFWECFGKRVTEEALHLLQITDY